MTGYIQVVTTVPDRKSAEAIARSLVVGGLAGCVQVAGPISSTFMWEGKIKKAREWICVAKTARSNFGRVESAIRKLHRYEVPEIVAVDISMGSTKYLDWLGSSVVRRRYR